MSTKNSCIEDFAILSKKITNVFPREQAATYYVAPIPKKMSGNKIHEKARGKLVDKQRNLLYMVKKLKSPKTNEIEADESYHQEVIDQEAKDSEIWLRRNTQPQCEVLQHWKQSYLARRNTQFQTIAQFLEQWPILRSPIAPDLINYDFAQVHKVPENFDLQTEFQNLFEAVLTQRKSSLSPADNTILQLLDTDDITSDSRRAIQLYLLASLVPPKGRTKVKKLHWKPSITEAREGVFVHVLTPGDIEQAKKQKINSMYSKGLTVQPYFIIIGPSLNNISQTLVIINQNTYQCNSILEALDFCFKSYIVLDAKYPFQSQHLWYLIQWIVYKYRAATDPKILFINDLVNS
ncbi:hypothetical protein PPYR_00125 [Photinus pyralis]|uniref:Uncharacterized protein n=1 Tax=Photinus pyralis TaxID=7054 RepID=A0A5N4B0N9_PHOPY|nr:hypothetical protein PPYR_00125 [Photinus pyralis]